MGTFRSNLHPITHTKRLRETKYRREVSEDNIVSNEEIQVLRGGIQTALTGTLALLIKHPLMFVDDEIEVMNTSVHWV